MLTPQSLRTPTRAVPSGGTPWCLRRCGCGYLVFFSLVFAKSAIDKLHGTAARRFFSHGLRRRCLWSGSRPSLVAFTWRRPGACLMLRGLLATSEMHFGRLKPLPQSCRIISRRTLTLANVWTWTNALAGIGASIAVAASILPSPSSITSNNFV